MAIRVLPDFLINQIAAGEVVERPASAVKELVENALDAGAGQIMIDVQDGGRTLISVIDDGKGMSREDLSCCVCRHATSKLPIDDLLNINFMGFRGEALPSIASVSDMTIDTCHSGDDNGWQLDCTSQDIRPSSWESGTRICVKNLFAKTPARLKFLQSDRSEMMAVLAVVKRLAMSRPDVGFVLNNKWRYPKNQNLLDRIVSVMGDDAAGRMLKVAAASGSVSSLSLSGYISEPTLRRASSVDQYLFVNGRPVKDKVLVGALRAAYMDVMHAREFPLCALYLSIEPRFVDVNVSPAKTDVHFLEPSHIRAFIIKSLRGVLAQTLQADAAATHNCLVPDFAFKSSPVQAGFTSSSVSCEKYGRGNAFPSSFTAIAQPDAPMREIMKVFMPADSDDVPVAPDAFEDKPLGRVIGQMGNKYILAQKGDNLVIVDQHAAHERITYEQLRNKTIKVQPLLTPIVINLRAEDVLAILDIAKELSASGLQIDSFGDGAVAIFEKPADWDLPWGEVLQSIADEVRANGHSSGLSEKLHLKLANYACHHSVRAGQKLDLFHMDALLRAIENTPHGAECNHGRPVYKFIPMQELDSWFERI